MEDLKQWKLGGRYEPHVFLWSLKFDNAHNNVQCKRIFFLNNLIFFCNCKNKQLFRAQVIAMKVTSPRQSLLFSVFNINCSVCLSPYPRVTTAPLVKKPQVSLSRQKTAKRTPPPNTPPQRKKKEKQKRNQKGNLGKHQRAVIHNDRF